MTINQRNIDFSKFTLKCANNDCSRNEEHRCCASCDSIKECIQKDWDCVHLVNGSPEGCQDLYLECEVI